jgi:hypothetical protein
LPQVNSGCHINEIASKILQQYQRLLEEHAPGFVEAVYIYGSVALDDYVPNKSDIDFIAISAERADSTQYRQLVTVHRLMKRANPNSNLGGIYVCWNDLGKSKTLIPPYPCCHSNRMQRKGYSECNEMTWWQLKHQAICLFSNREGALDDFGVHADRMKRSITLSIQNYWKPWVDKRSSYLSYNRWLLACFPGLVEWGVLTLSRQYYALSTGNITSKTKAGLYCLQRVPKKYQKFLQEVIDIRNNGRAARVSINWQRSQLALEYMRYLIAECE